MTSVHKPYDNRIFQKECKTLSVAGYQTLIIVPHKMDEIKEDVKIRSVPLPKNRKERMISTTWRIFCVALKERANLYHFHDPELIPIGITLKLMGKKVIYDVHEDFASDILTKHWIPASIRGIIKTFIRIIEWFGASIFDGIVAATPAIAKNFPQRKTIAVQNYVIINDKINNSYEEYKERKATAVYIGDITDIRGLGEVVKAMDLLPRTMGVRLSLAGRFSPPEYELILKETEGWENVDFLGWLDRDKIKSLLAEARVGLVTFHPTKNHIEAQPNKLFEYMAAGIPIIASDFPLWRNIIGENNCGILVDPLYPSDIAKAIKWILENPIEAEEMGKRGKQIVNNVLNWEKESKKLLALYWELLSLN